MRLLTAAAVCGLLLVPARFQGAIALDAPELPRGMDPWCCDPEQVPAWELEKSPPRLVPRAKRHREFIQAGVPLEYRGLRSPFPAVTMAIDQGGRLYRAHCLACHGATGLGDGDAGRDLTPSPALLARLMDIQGSVDEYLLWTISEGGAPFGTEMPAFKATLSEREIWEVVGYMRAGFPPDEAE